ncbi:hypothetical protein [Azospirillum doebereinerae]
MRTLLLEGGGRINGVFLRHRPIDEFSTLIHPTVLSVLEGEALQGTQARTLPHAGRTCPPRQSLRKSTAAAKTWHRLQGEDLLPKVIHGVIIRDGVEVTEAASQNPA